MKRIFVTFLSLCCLLSVSLMLQAQPAQKLVNIIVSPNKADWKYKTGEQVTFDVQVFKDNVLLPGVSVDYELGPEFFPTEVKSNYILKDGKTTLKATMKEPGFLRCKVTANVDGRQYEELTTVGYDVEKIAPTVANPQDFDQFWTNVLSEARKTPLDSKMVLLPERCTSTQNVYEVSFQNDRYGSRMYGILMMPKKEGKYPAILQVPGAGVSPHGGVNYGDDVISLDMGIHGVTVTQPYEMYGNLMGGGLRDYWRANMNDKENHYYKRVYTGCVRAVDFLFDLPQFDGSTIGVTGGSQGGALSIVVAGLEPRIQFLAAYYPALCDHAGYLNKRAGGWPHYFKDINPKQNEVETLAYYDVVNFARRVNVPGFYTWGFNDVVCPPTSMYAAYNVIPAQKELSLFLNTGHWTYPQQNQEANDWLKEKCK